MLPVHGCYILWFIIEALHAAVCCNLSRVLHAVWRRRLVIVRALYNECIIPITYLTHTTTQAPSTHHIFIHISTPPYQRHVRTKTRTSEYFRYGLIDPGLIVTTTHVYNTIPLLFGPFFRQLNLWPGFHQDLIRGVSWMLSIGVLRSSWSDIGENKNK